jgi:hypothetical protein
MVNSHAGMVDSYTKINFTKTNNKRIFDIIKKPMPYPFNTIALPAHGRTLITPPYLRRGRGWLRQTTSSFAPDGEK